MKQVSSVYLEVSGRFGVVGGKQWVSGGVGG